MIDVSGTNQSGGVYAGIEVYASQTKFELSSSWYNHRTLPKSTIYSPENAHAGAGWLNRGERNMYIGCTAQENGGHGWALRLGKSQFIGCLGESSSFEGTLIEGRQAKPMEAANWYIMKWATGLRLVAPRSHNPKDDLKASLYGFYIEGGTNDLQIIGGSVIDERMSESNLKNRRVCAAGPLGNQVILQIDALQYQKFTTETLKELPGGTWVY
jgi:exopolysaccharide biosynthesis protein related to N-acetylglucosamine-1-phosphodiester alpha-N-acetylglucosaminidase